MPEEKTTAERAMAFAAQVTQPEQLKAPVSAQAAVLGAIVTAALGGGLGASGGLTLVGAHDHESYVQAADLDRVEDKIDKVERKVDSLDRKFVELRVALAAAGVTTPKPDSTP